MLGLALAGLLGACALHGPDRMGAQPTSLHTLPGWAAEHPAAAIPALRRDCERLARMPADRSLGGTGITAQLGGRAGTWAGPCADLRTLPPGDIAARAFFERDFIAYRLTNRGRSTALFTGYYEPEIRGSLQRGGVYQTPAYARPDDLVAVDLGQFDPTLAGQHSDGRLVEGRLRPYYNRAEIEHGALAGRGLELVWLADPVDLFFLQIQGSGRVRLPDGRVVRLGYDGKNGRPYTPIGKLLADQHQLPANAITADNIRAWLATHPDRAAAMMDQNQDYVFFKPLSGLSPQDGAPGTLGVSLSPGRSAAVDPADIPLGAPLWIDTTDPITGKPWQRLMQAEDLGAAIRGPTRADLFYGWGADAEARAGRAHQAGTLTILLPRVRPNT